jgi:transposase
VSESIIKEDHSSWFDEVRKRAEEHGDPRRVECWNPEAAAKALWLLAQGKSILSIARNTGLSRDTIRALSWRHNDTLETKRKEFSQRYAQAAEEYTDLLFKKAEQLNDNPDQLTNISPDKLALTVGILTDKASQLSGMAGVVIEHRKGASIDDAARLIAEAKARVASRATVIIDAEVIA